MDHSSEVDDNEWKCEKRRKNNNNKKSFNVPYFYYGLKSIK